MSDEIKGRRAKEILTDDVFVEAEAMAKTKVMTEWERETDPAKREALWHQIQALRATRVALEVLVGRWQTAAHQAHKESRLNA